MSQVVKHTPPSLFTVFENFDCCMRLGKPPQGGTGGGLLVGVSISGLPLAEPPVMEIYGPTEQLYSSYSGEEGNVVSVCLYTIILYNGESVPLVSAG